MKPCHLACGTAPWQHGKHQQLWQDSETCSSHCSSITKFPTHKLNPDCGTMSSDLQGCSQVRNLAPEWVVFAVSLRAQELTQLSLAPPPKFLARWAVLDWHGSVFQIWPVNRAHANLPNREAKWVWCPCYNAMFTFSYNSVFWEWPIIFRKITKS